MTTPTARPVPSNSPVDLLFNAEKLDEVVNATEPHYLDRFGKSRLTVQGAVDTIKSITSRGAWAALTDYDSKDVVLVSGTWYIAVTPHTSSAAFATDVLKWRVYQGVLASDLSAPSGSDLFGFLQAGAGSVLRTGEDKLRERISILDKGAVGGGADDTAAFVACMAMGPYVEIEVPPGEWISAPFAVGAHITIKGAGKNLTTIKQKAGTTGNFVTAGSASGTAFKGLTIDGNKVNCPSGAIGLVVNGTQTGDAGVLLDDCAFNNSKTFGCYQAGTYTNFDVFGCDAFDNGFDGIVSSTATGAVMSCNRAARNARFGILSQGANVRLLCNHAWGNGISMAGGAGIGVIGAAADSATAANNHCYNNIGHGLQFNGCDSGRMIGNECYSNSISGLDMYDTRRCTCTANTSYLNTVRGIEVDTGSFYNVVSSNIVYRNLETGISVFRSPGTIIIGNQSTENGQYGIRLWDSANTLPSSNCRLIGNNCSDDRGGSATQQYGVSIENNATGITLIGNTLLPNVLGAVNLVNGQIAQSVANQGYARSDIATALTLLAGWVAYDVNWQAPASYLDANGILHLTGSMKSGTVTAGTVIGNLPAGRRPGKVAGPFRVYTETGGGSIIVTSTGAITAQTALDGTRTSLDGISFEAQL